eukprot:452605-Pyramimonas_sp.AAC.1
MNSASESKRLVRMRLCTFHAAEETHCSIASCINSLMSNNTPSNLKLSPAGRERDRMRWPSLLGCAMHAVALL